jgi:antitoxin component YwqK of YwqJK toxin-antitoxin module
MKRILGILIVVLFSCQKKRELVVPKVFVEINASSMKFKQDTLYLETEKYSGFVYQLNPKTKDTLLLMEFVKGLQVGWSKKYYDNGNVQEVRQFSKGKKNGKQISYWENGNKRFEFMAKNDAYEGVLKEWDKEGKLYHLGNFVNGQEEGSQKMWYQNGKIKANYVVRNGKRYGLLGTKNCMNVSDSIFNNQ